MKRGGYGEMDDACARCGHARWLHTSLDTGCTEKDCPCPRGPSLAYRESIEGRKRATED